MVVLTAFAMLLMTNVQAQPLTGNERFVSLEGVYLRPLGLFGEEWKSGIGLYAGYALPLDLQTFMPMRTGFISLKHQQAFKSIATFTIIPIHFGIRYLFFNSRLSPFVEVMNGLNLIHETVDLRGRDNERFLVRYFWQAGTGAVIPITERLDLSLGMRYNAAFYENDKVQYGEQGAMMTAFEYSIGFNWHVR
ncbi:MAG: hypothetical protein KA247_03250 [Bacteroidetes bacterium]|nr:hypothetical protein [Bacteroidota bacterium]